MSKPINIDGTDYQDPSDRLADVIMEAMDTDALIFGPIVEAHRETLEQQISKFDWSKKK